MGYNEFQSKQCQRQITPLTDTLSTKSTKPENVSVLSEITTEKQNWVEQTTSATFSSVSSSLNYLITYDLEPTDLTFNNIVEICTYFRSFTIYTECNDKFTLKLWKRSNEFANFPKSNMCQNIVLTQIWCNLRFPDNHLLYKMLLASVKFEQITKQISLRCDMMCFSFFWISLLNTVYRELFASV